MRRIGIVAVLAVGALLFTGCGSSGGSDSSDTTEAKAGGSKTTTTAKATTTADPGSDADRAAYVEALTTGLSSGDEAVDLVVGKDEAACIAPKFVDAMTVATLKEKDVDPKDMAEPGWDSSGLGLSKAQGAAMVDAFEPCGVDIYEKFVAALTGGFTDEQVACASENLDEDLARDLLVVTFAGSEGTTEFEAVIEQLTTACDLPPD